MGVLKAILSGMGTTFRKPRILVILYIINLVFAAALAFPLISVIQNELGHSFLGSNVRPIDLGWLGEAAVKYRDAFTPLAGGLLVGAFFYLALHVFLNGGLIGRLLDREGPTTLAAFFSDCGRYFWRFSRLFFVSLVFLLPLIGLILWLISALFDPLIQNAATQWLPIILSNLHVLVALLLLSIVRMVVDYARIAVVADEERKVLKALGHALAFLKKRFFRAWAIYLIIVAGTLAGTAVFYGIFGPLGGPGNTLVLAGLVWMQLYLLFRIWLRTLFVSAQAEYYRSHPY